MAASPRARTEDPANGKPDRKARRAFVIVALTAVALAALLTGAWYYLAGELDARVASGIERARAEGTQIECPGRRVFGYPFRLGLHCDAVTVDAAEDGVRVAAGELRTAAQIYRPNRIVAELDAPLRIVSAEAPPLDIGWQLLQASATFWSQGLDHFALVAEEPVVSLVQPAGARDPVVTAAHTETHARRRGEDLDLASTGRDIRIVAPNAPDLPAFAASVDLTVERAANWLAGAIPGDTPGEALAGHRIHLRSLSLDLPDSSAELSGNFVFEQNGTVTGTFDLAVTDPTKIATLVGQAAPQLASAASSVASALSFIGRRENGRSVVSFRVDHGKLSAGIIPLGSIPPLR